MDIYDETDKGIHIAAVYKKGLDKIETAILKASKEQNTTYLISSSSIYLYQYLLLTFFLSFLLTYLLLLLTYLLLLLTYLLTFFTYSKHIRIERKKERK